MVKAACTDQEFIDKWRAHGSPGLVAQVLGQGVRVVQQRRRAIEARYGIALETFNDRSPSGAAAREREFASSAGRANLTIRDGVVLAFSDAHYWTGYVSTAHKALVSFCRMLKPLAIVNNGDSLDGATISRFPRPFFDESKPTVLSELSENSERLAELKQAAPGAERFWNLGNHDLRFEARLAANNPEYQGVRGFHLKDHFLDWRPSWSVWINEEVEIRHRYKGGIHATHNNVMANHHTTITGHLHSLQVRPYTDGRGVIKYGVDTGTLADVNGPQFSDYMEGRIPNWRSGFVVLTFKNGELLMPELVMKHSEGVVQFRGHLLSAETGEIL